MGSVGLLTLALTLARSDTTALGWSDPLHGNSASKSECSNEQARSCMDFMTYLPQSHSMTPLVSHKSTQIQERRQRLHLLMGKMSNYLMAYF